MCIRDSPRPLPLRRPQQGCPPLHPVPPHPTSPNVTSSIITSPMSRPLVCYVTSPSTRGHVRRPQ
eukprot:2751613-Rhodomonas_salina.2